MTTRPSTAPATSPRRRPVLRACVWIGCTLAWVACGSLVAPQQWDARRGPVVPHDSFPADCTLCHIPPGWHRIAPDFAFDHAAETGVALRGAHAEAECLRCHNDRGPVERFAARGCAGCHVDPHRGKLGTTCASCHDEQDWQPRAQIARHARTRFPLVGAHAVAQCWQCHPGAQTGNFEGLDPDCLGCHASDLGRASRPDHRAQGWTSDCQRCHLPLSWAPARFDHPASFPLQGGHAGHSCHDCHGDSGVFAGLDPTCVSCHLADHRATTDPDHRAAGFSTDCQTCHAPTAWQAGRFAHPASFPLTGGHGAADCSACHAGGRFAGTPTACVDCHLTDYQATANPDHRAAGFSTDCQSCHDTASWRGATFDHRFPIDRGDHAGLSCTDCHTTAGSTTAFSCTHCHEHSQAEMADEHRDVRNYVWSSPACLNCHPDGRER